jgi:hypothetical protein
MPPHPIGRGGTSPAYSLSGDAGLDEFPHSGDRIAQSDPQWDQETGLRHRRVVARHPIKTTRRTRPLTALAALGRELYELTASAAKEPKPFSRQRRRAVPEYRAKLAA